jgi:hypothetical protein
MRLWLIDAGYLFQAQRGVGASDLGPLFPPVMSRARVALDALIAR